MIKQIHEITLKDIVLLDKTKSARHLLKYPFIPVYFVKNKLEKLAKEIFDLIGSNTIEQIENETAKIISLNNLQILEALYKAVQIELNLKAQINVWKLIIDREYKESPLLEQVLKAVLEHTGIDIKTPEDLKRFEDLIEFKIDKHRENYPSIKPDEKQEVKLQKVLYSIFNYLGEPFNENIRLITFIEMKELAEYRIKQAQKQIENGSITRNSSN